MTTIDAITADYLSTALGREVTAVTVEPIGVGVGLIGQLYRVRPTYASGSGGPDSVVVKLPGATEESRFVAMVLNMYQKECGFYRELAAASGDLSPGSHHVTFEPESHDFVLLLDDVGHHRQADQISGIELADAEIAVRALARLNASWWEHPDLLASPYARPLNESPFPEAVSMSYDGAWPTALEAYGSMMSDPIRDFGARYSSLFRWFCDRLCEPPVTLTHGDWRGDNLFFTDDPDVPLIAVDWQLISVAKGVKDFTYFVTQSLTPADRAAHEEGLLRIWLDELKANGVGGYELDEAWEDYRIAVAWAFVYPVIATSTLDPTDERGAALTRSMLERSIAAIDHVDALAVLPDA
ncbi:MAG: oxidoreductase family protein [Acidimicrobiia bacterium]